MHAQDPAKMPTVQAEAEVSRVDSLLDDFLREPDEDRRLPVLGDVVGGVYRILGELGRGAMGVVQIGRAHV